LKASIFIFFRAGIAAFIGKGTVRNHIGKTVACPTVESQPEQPQHLSKSSPKQKLGRLQTSKKQNNGIEETKRISTLQQHKARNHSLTPGASANKALALF